MKVFPLLMLLLLTTYSFGQENLVRTQKISIEDGLSSRFVYSILKDQKGFVWIGSSFGLNRYDGYSFKSYTSARNAITNQHIKKLLEDDQGNIWLCNIAWSHPNSIFRQIDIFDPTTERAIPFDSILHNFDDLRKGNIAALTTDEKQCIYIASNTNKLYTYQNKEVLLLPCQFPDSTATIDRIIATSSFIWVKTGRILWTLNHQGLILNQRSLSPVSGLVGLDHSGQLWWWEEVDKKIILKHIDASKKIHSYSHPKLELLSKPIRELDRYEAIRINPNNNTIWCESDQYLHILDPKKESTYSFDKKELESSVGYNGFPVPFPEIYIDNQNLAWICTTRGIQKMSLQQNLFKSYLPKHSTRGIFALSRDSILVASYSGLKLVTNKNSYNLEPATDPNLGALAGQGMDILEDPSNNCIWISSGDDILAQYNTSNNTFKYDTIPPLHLSIKETNIENYALSLFTLEKHKNTIWIGTTEGLFSYNISTKKFSLFDHYNNYNNLKGAIIYELLSSSEGLWIASDKGLFLLDYQSGIVEEWSIKNKNTLPFDIILHIHKDKSGILWLATKGGGIIRLDRQQKSHQQITTREGLSHDIVYSIYEDNFGYLWMSSNYGLMRFDKKTSLINTYLPKDGIPHEEFNRASHHQAADGTLYFGGLNGIIQFHPKDFILQHNNNEQLQITSYHQFDGNSGALVDKTTLLLDKKQIRLAANDKFFTLSFALLDFKNPKSNKYAYRITGYETEWTFTNMPNIRITGLPAGRYVLEIKAQGANGQWTKNPIKIQIVVLLPFYKTWWFILLASLSLILVLVGYARWRVSQLQQRQKELHQEVKRRTLQIEADKKTIEEQAQKLQNLDNVKSRFFANISHELRTPLTLILGPINTITKKDYEDNTQKIEKIINSTLRSGQQLQQLIEEILELSKLEANKMDLKLEPTLLFPFIKQLCSPFETQANILKINIDLLYNLPLDFCILLDKTKFEKIVNNLLSNALKYTTNQGFIKISIKEIDQKIHIEVQDSGQGIHSNDLPYIFDRYYQSRQTHSPIQGGTGIGLALAKELTQFLGGKLNVTSTLGQGSTFTLTLPFEEATLKNNLPHLLLEEIINPTVLRPEYNQEINILIVEDNLDMQQYIGDILSPYYQISYAENGASALTYIQKKERLPQLIISDWMMPIMDGIQLLHNLKNSSLYTDIPIIMLTARAEEKNKLEALILGVDDYLIKPFLAAELLVRIQNLLKRSQQRTDFRAAEIEPVEKLESADGKWLQEVKKVVEKELQNSQFGISFLATELHISERQLHRKIKNLTGLTPNKYIREIKLLIAREALEQQKFLTVSELAHFIGFSNVSHFSNLYIARFGKSPSDYS